MMKFTDDAGNLWHEQAKFENRHNHGSRGVHVLCIPFQCEECWILNLEGRLPIPERDGLYMILLC